MDFKSLRPRVNLVGKQFPQGRSAVLATPHERTSLNAYVANSQAVRGPSGESRRANLASLGNKAGVKKGTEMYRLLGEHDIKAFQGMKPGDTHDLTGPMSVAGADALQTMGEVASGKQRLQSNGGYNLGGKHGTFAKITTFDDVPGVERVNDYLHAKKAGEVEGWDTEGMLGEGTRLSLSRREPATENTPEFLHFTAHRVVSGSQHGQS